MSMNSKSHKRQIKTGKASGLRLRLTDYQKIITILVIIVAGHLGYLNWVN